MIQLYQFEKNNTVCTIGQKFDIVSKGKDFLCKMLANSYNTY